MQTMFKAAAFATLSLGLVQAAEAAPARKPVAAPIAAPAATATAVAPGIGFADIEAIKNNSNAFRLAIQQRADSYKANIDQYRARGAQIEAQQKATVAKLEADSKAPNANQAAIQQQVQAYQAQQQAWQKELNDLIAPVKLSEAFVDEQIYEKMGPAVSAVLKEQNITLLLNPQSIVVATSKTYDLNLAILTKLNSLIPAAQVVPPVGWEPREVREAKAQQAAQAGQAPAAAAPAAPAAPAANAPKPSGR